MSCPRAEPFGEVLVAAGQPQRHEYREVQLGGDGNYEDERETYHPELGAVVVHLCRVSEEFYCCHKTENERIRVLFACLLKLAARYIVISQRYKTIMGFTTLIKIHSLKDILL